MIMRCQRNLTTTGQGEKLLETGCLRDKKRRKKKALPIDVSAPGMGSKRWY